MVQNPEPPRNMSVWFLRHIFGHVPEDLFINFRAIKNQPPVEGESKKKAKTVTLYNQNVQKGIFARIWREELFQNLSFYNNEGGPANIYFGVNPRTCADPAKNSKEDVPGVFCLNLDMDVTSEYSIEDRLSQIGFLNFLGLHPLVTHSGHGLQAFFVLENPLPQEEGEALNKELIKKFGCKDKGNTHDCTRIMRLPGFLNRKFWFTGDSPPCVIIRPDGWKNIPNFFLENPKFSKERISQIPNGTKEFLLKIKETAQKMPGEDLTLAQKTAMLLEKIKRDGMDTAYAVKAEEISREGKQTALAIKAKIANRIDGALDQIPHPDNIKFPKQTKFWRKYCLLGFDGLTPKEIDEAAFTAKMEDKSASCFDYRLLRILMKMGFSDAAIQNFWHRHDLKLQRPEKHERYFDLSMARAKADHQAAIEKKLSAALESPIITEKNETFFRTPTQTVFKIMNCALKTKRVMNQCEGGITGDSFLETAITYPAPNGAEPFSEIVTFKAAALNSWTELKRVLPFRVCILTGAENILGHLKNFLLQDYIADPEEQEEIGTRITYRRGIFYLPHLKIGKDHFSPQAFYNPSVGHALISQFGSKVLPLQEIRKLLDGHLLPFIHCHKPDLVYAVLGIAGAAVLKPIFQTELGLSNFPIPSLNVRGKPSTGKSFTVPKLLSILGWMGESGQSSFGIQTTDFACQKLFDFLNWFPALFDEFKESTYGDRKCCDRLRMWMRKSYSGEIDLKGTFDQKLISYFINAPFVVLGEHEAETEELALVTRMMIADSTGFDVSHPDAKARWENIQKTDFRVLGPHIFQFALNISPKTYYGYFQKFKAYFLAKLKSEMGLEKERIAHNFATFCTGLRFLKDFFASLDPEFGEIFLSLGDPADILLNPYLEWIKKREFFRLKKQEEIEFSPEESEDFGGPSENFHEKHCIHDFLRIICDLIKRKHILVKDLLADGIPIFAPPLDTEEFAAASSACLDFGGAYLLYREYLKRCGEDPLRKSLLVADISNIFKSQKGQTITSEIIAIRFPQHNKYFPGKRIREGFTFNPKNFSGYNIF